MTSIDPIPPGVPERFQLFGFAGRRKLLYQSGKLRDALNGEVVRAWDVRRVVFEPGEYRVSLDTQAGRVVVVEDEVAVWIEEAGDRRMLTPAAVHLPSFAGHPQAPLLRALHGELLVNVLPWGPVPNLWVYPRPWYRDAAMMALALAHTGNAALLEEWIAGLHQPYDYNNRGVAEPDNLGQALYLASLAGGRAHRIVDKVLAEAASIRKGDHLHGLSDFGEHPVYQTKWLKFGLRALGMDDSDWRIPAVADAYSALFWMDFRSEHVAAPRFDAAALALYPYLNWAEAHFHGERPPESPAADAFPLTREVRASEANYRRMRLVAPQWSAAAWASPHTWHAAEMFLYFLDKRVFPQTGSFPPEPHP